MEFLKAIMPKIHSLARGLFFGLMVTTMWMAYTVADRAIGGSAMLPDIYSSALVVLAAIIVTYLIDDGLHKNAVASFAQSIKHKGFWRIHKPDGITTLIMVMLMAARFFFSGGATYLTGETTVVGKEADSQAYEKTTALQDKKTSALARIEKTYRGQAKSVMAQAQSEAKQIKQDAQRLAERTVEVAIKQGSPVEQADYKAGRWVRSDYSIAIKAAERKAYKMEEEASKKAQRVIDSAKERRDQLLTTMQEEIYKERNNPKWSKIEERLNGEIWAETMLISAERWTYYLLDFILIVGALGCSYLQAAYIVRGGDDATLETFFPNKPSLLQVVESTFSGAYEAAVAFCAQLPAALKASASKTMSSSAKSIANSNKKYTEAIAKFMVASDPTSNALHGAVAYQKAAQEVKAEVERTRQSASARAESGPRASRERAPSRAIAPEAPEGYTGGASVPMGEPIDLDALSFEAPQRKQPIVNSHAKAGKNFRAHMSKVRKYYREGKIDAALRRLDAAKNSIPEDHLAEQRAEQIEQLRKTIEENDN